MEVARDGVLFNNIYNLSQTKFSEEKRSHAVFISHPQEVADVTTRASKGNR